MEQKFFNLFWDDVNKIIRTNIRHTYECDTFMPPIDPGVFILETSIPGETNPEDPVDYAYEYWVRKDTP
ncbi:dihydrofolate reductase [Globicatella sanguinis]|uniref:dihydrofolate reductase n=1 Tax=Globicatella sanguinis TaxID=13076 RepID=UPI0025426CDB|nr:dihydrofolate reductase [Globicatella sanguinis]WIK65832.1 dihydrofolate reductase [Globicatella sanguinis]WKT55237.1 dihydrofolate reductase [Globicatella sanguinis]